MEEKKIDYYKIAVDWGKNYLLNNTESKSFKYKPAETILDDLHFVSITILRIENSNGREKQASYRRMREFKRFLEGK
jgi:hypothetical protein